MPPSEIQHAAYSWLTPHLDARPIHIAEVGARDCEDSVWLANRFGCSVDAFEADPANHQRCRATLAANPGAAVRLHEIALTNATGIIAFESVDPSLMANPGASSFFRINFENRLSRDADSGRAPVQVSVRVPAARFDELSLQTPDLLVMDVQGAELLVLEGFGAALSAVEWVCLEAAPVSAYVGGATLWAVHSFMVRNGFSAVAGEGLSLSHVNYVLGREGIWSRAPTAWQKRRRFRREFNLLYRRMRR